MSECPRPKPEGKYIIRGTALGRFIPLLRVLLLQRRLAALPRRPARRRAARPQQHAQLPQRLGGGGPLCWVLAEAGVNQVGHLLRSRVVTNKSVSPSVSQSIKSATSCSSTRSRRVALLQSVSQPARQAGSEPGSDGRNQSVSVMLAR